jgi:tetratricopeptide (TPR) repeat protein
MKNGINLTLLLFLSHSISVSPIQAQNNLNQYSIIEIDSIWEVLLNAGAYKELIYYAQIGREKAEKKFGAQDTIYARMLFSLGKSYHLNQNYTQAKIYYQKAINIQQEKIPKNPNHAASLGNLAVLHMGLGRYNKAESPFSRMNRNKL